MKKIGIRILSGDPYGWGNFDRQYNLALYLKKKAKIFFFIENSYKAYEIANKKFKSYFLKNRMPLRNEKKFYKDKKFDFFIYEGERLPKENQLYYSSISKKFIIFDDNLSKKNYLCDRIFCSQLNSNYKKINNLTKKKIKYGYKYFPIYIKKRKFLLKQNKKIILSLGGGNYTKSYKIILDYFANKKYNFLIYSNNKQTILELKKKYRNNIYFKFFYNVKNIFNSFPSGIEFAIVNGGYNKILFNFLKIPTAILSTRYHQLDLTKKFCEHTLNYNLGYYKYMKVSKLKKFEKYLISKKYNKQKFIFNSNNLKTISNLIFR